MELCLKETSGYNQSENTLSEHLRILATADVHLGRRSTHVGDELTREDTATTTVWRDLVDLAIEQEVDAVLLAGDIVDEQNKYYEAYGPLESGLRRLAEAGIQAFGVAGNHDYNVFPRLMETLGADTFRLLGAGGCWDRVRFAPKDKAACELVGWSFPERSYSKNPLTSLEPAEERNLPTIGLLHTQIDDSQNRYAPVPRHSLGLHGVDLWVLGHVHQARWYEEGSSRALYCGSPQAIDPGETGAHGAWLLTVEADGAVEAKHLPLSHVRYERLQVDLNELATVEEINATISRTVSDFADEIEAEDSGRLRGLFLRLLLEGRTAAHRELPDLAERIREELRPTRGRIEVVIDDVIVNAGPDLDLDELAVGKDIAGELAVIILALERGDAADDTVRSLLQTAQRKVSSWQAPVRDVAPEPELEELRAELLQVAWRLLDTLIAGKETV